MSRSTPEKQSDHGPVGRRGRGKTDRLPTGVRKLRDQLEAVVNEFKREEAGKLGENPDGDERESPGLCHWKSETADMLTTWAAECSHKLLPPEEQDRQYKKDNKRFTKKFSRWDRLYKGMRQRLELLDYLWTTTGPNKSHGLAQEHGVGKYQKLRPVIDPVTGKQKTVADPKTGKRTLLKKLKDYSYLLVDIDYEDCAGTMSVSKDRIYTYVKELVEAGALVDVGTSKAKVRGGKKLYAIGYWYDIVNGPLPWGVQDFVSTQDTTVYDTMIKMFDRRHKR